MQPAENGTHCQRFGISDQVCRTMIESRYRAGQAVGNHGPSWRQPPESSMAPYYPRGRGSDQVPLIMDHEGAMPLLLGVGFCGQVRPQSRPAGVSIEQPTCEFATNR